MPNAMQIKITLKSSGPTIWRRILIKESITLDDLHHIIQCSMGWMNSHMHEFEFQGIIFRPNDDFCDTENSESTNKKLSSLKLKEKDVIFYTYDFGDNWEHTIFIEKITSINKSQLYPFCTKAIRACPPEDCGGIFGYENMLDIISDKSHPEHDETVEWIGEDFDPNYTSLKEINSLLQEPHNNLLEFNFVKM